MRDWIVPLACISVAAASPALGQTHTDELALRRLAEGFGEAWGRYDARALAAQMADNIVMVTAGGRRLEGRTNIENYHGRLFRGSARGSTNTTTNVRVRFLRPDTGLVERSWRIDGDRYSDGRARASRTGLTTMVAERRSGVWQIVSAHTSNIAGVRTTAPCNCPATPPG